MKQYPKVTRSFPDRQPELIRQPEPVSGLFALAVVSVGLTSVVGGALLAWWLL